MLSWLKQLFQSSPPVSIPTEQPTLALESDLQKLRLELAERDQTITNLKQELDRQRQGEQDRLNQSLKTAIESLFNELAPSISQLSTQIHLQDNEGKTLQAKDVLAINKRLIHTLENQGLSIPTPVGKTVTFDPNHHQPLNSQTNISPGQLVIIRLPGIAYQNKILKKALVEKT